MTRRVASPYGDTISDTAHRVWMVIAAHGSDTPVQIAGLCDNLHLTPRRVRSVVESLRRAGMPVGAENVGRDGRKPGLYRIRTEKEWQATKGQLLSKARAIEQTVTAIEKHLDTWIGSDGQMALL